MHASRRALLSLVATTAVAGCTGSDGDGSDTATPEATTTSPPTTAAPEPAAFEVVGYEAPDTVELRTEFTLSVTVANTGDQPGEFAAPLSRTAPDGARREVAQVAPGEIPAGGTATFETEPLALDYIGRYTFRVAESSTTVRAVPASLQWGTDYRTPAGYVIRVTEPTLQDTFEYEGGYDDIEERGPSGDRQWAFVDVAVDNETGAAAPSPSASDFVLVGADARYDNYVIVDDPINRGPRFEGGELQPDAERSGWVSYAIADDLGVSDLRVAWSGETADGEVGAVWGAEE